VKLIEINLGEYRERPVLG